MRGVVIGSYCWFSRSTQKERCTLFVQDVDFKASKSQGICCEKLIIDLAKINNYSDIIGREFLFDVTERDYMKFVNSFYPVPNTK